jgi:predicted AlkP superfamily phosphohydrolase/phosphomutase
MKNAMANIHPFYDIYVSETEMGFWKIVMEGVYAVVHSLLMLSSPQKVLMPGEFSSFIWTWILPILLAPRRLDL